jgi:hypothetical protein
MFTERWVGCSTYIPLTFACVLFALKASIPRPLMVGSRISIKTKTRVSMFSRVRHIISLLLDYDKYKLN